jgi:hypothetical protein
MFPFSVVQSEYFRLLAPILWILIAFLLSTAVTVFVLEKEELFSRKYVPFALLFVFSLFATMFSPDSFGFNHGGYIRERFLFCALIFFVPLFRFGKSAWLKKLAQFCLVFVIVYQTAALSDFASQTNSEAKEFLAAGAVLDESDKSVASVILMAEPPRFYSRPVAQMSDYFGFDRDLIGWDNYEIGHYIFPIIAKDTADREFVLNYTNANMFYLSVPGKTFDDTLSGLDECLKNNHQKITALIVWGADERVEKIINKWFNAEPVFSNERVRVLRHK